MSKFYPPTELMNDIRGVPLEERSKIYDEFLDSGKGVRREQFKEIYSHLKRGLNTQNSSAMPGWLQINDLVVPEPSLPYAILHQIASYAATGEVRNPKQDKKRKEKRYDTNGKIRYGLAADTFQRGIDQTNFKGPGHHY